MKYIRNLLLMSCCLAILPLHGKEVEEKAQENQNVEKQKVADQQESKKVALAIVTALTDDLAKLIINQRGKKDPEITKESCVGLIQSLTDLIFTIIEKVRISKNNRTFQELSPEQYQAQLMLIAYSLHSEIEKNLL